MSSLILAHLHPKLARAISDHQQLHVVLESMYLQSEDIIRPGLGHMAILL